MCGGELGVPPCWGDDNGGTTRCIPSAGLSVGYFSEPKNSRCIFAPCRVPDDARGFLGYVLSHLGPPSPCCPPIVSHLGPPPQYAQAYPLDLLRTRLAAQTADGGGPYYRGITHAAGRIVAEEGALGMYRGLGATLAQVRGRTQVWGGGAQVWGLGATLAQVRGKGQWGGEQLR